MYYAHISDLNVDVLKCSSFDSTFSRALRSFELYIQGVQGTIVNIFHQRQNDFVRDKMKIVPTVLNLCKIQTPTALIDVLSLGTKAVPHDQICDYDCFIVLDQDLRNVIASAPLLLYALHVGLPTKF